MYSTSPLFQKMKLPFGQHQIQNLASQDKKLNWVWFNPPQKCIPVEFCLDTSLHGLQYLGQERRHVFERLFWLVAFLASMITATVLIERMWKDYTNMPIVTIFRPTETTLDEIPFPSVTVCNVNGFQKSTSKKYSEHAFWKDAKNGSLNGVPSDPEQRSILATLVDMSYICDSCITFLEQLVGNNSGLQSLEKVIDHIGNNIEALEPYLNPVATLYHVSQPCDKMITGCIWQSEITDCSKLWHEVVTDFGYCCTFNTIPAALLIKNFNSGNNNRNDSEYIEAWKNLDVAKNLTYDHLMFSKDAEDQSRKLPYRQRYPGRKAGLSFVLNPDLNEYHCTNTDSEGFMIGIAANLDLPRMKDKSVAVRTQSEVFIGVRPEITMSDEGIKGFPLKKRQCYIGNEYKLGNYTKYSASNCMNECIAREVMLKCGCVRYYMPYNHSNADELCKPNKVACCDKVETWIFKNGLSNMCPECLPTCTEIEYRREVSVLPIQKEKIKKYQQLASESFQANDMSIVHVYFDVDSTYARLRKEFTTMTQLLSNTGGLLGLCMGFSVLSLLEILYYGTIRICFSYLRENTVADQ